MRELILPRKIHKSILLASSLLVCGFAHSQAVPADIGNANIINQQEREKAIKGRLDASPNIDLQGKQEQFSYDFSILEAPCFEIRSITLTGESSDQFQFALEVLGQDKTFTLPLCMGQKGINAAMLAVQNAIIAKGYVTTSVRISEQDLKSGQIQFIVIPGKVAQFIVNEGQYSPRVAVSAAFPMGVGDILNIRDIEQALENYTRLPTVQADIKLAPSQEANASDILISWKQDKPYRLTLGVDNSGTPALGTLVGTATIELDDLLGLNDMFYVVKTNNFGATSTPYSNAGGYTVAYSIPYQEWLLSTSASSYVYQQTIYGAVSNYQYGGTSANQDAKLARTIYRDGSIKVGLFAGVWSKQQTNDIDGVQVAIQDVRESGYQFGSNYHQAFGGASFDATGTYKLGTHAWGSIPASGENLGVATSAPRILLLNTNLNAPFEVLGENWRLNNMVSYQNAWTPLMATDNFAIGNHFSVRGFNGSNILLAQDGWFTRNDLCWAINHSAHELYVGVDYGQIGGLGTQTLSGTSLAGAAVGVRGQPGDSLKGVYYDFYASKPVEKPIGFIAAAYNFGFSVSYTY